MNKILKLTVTFLAATVLFASCAEFLDTRAQSEFDESVIFSNPILAEGALFEAHHILMMDNSYRNRLIHTFTNSDTERRREFSMTPATRNALSVYHIVPNNTDMDAGNNLFGRAYEAIEALNIMLNGIRTYGNLEDPAMQRLYGEALALRAFLYFDLIRWYGDVPARFEPVSNATIRLPRTERDEIYKQILDDLAIAAEMLPWPGFGGHDRIDRMSQAFARAFRARVALHAGGYSLRACDGFGGGGPQMRRSVILDRTEMYEIARHETATLMANEGTGFSFSQNFEQIFRENMAEMISTGREIIFELPYAPGARGQWLSFHGARHDGQDKFSASGQLVKGETGPTPIMWYWFNDNDIRRDVSIIPWRYAAGQTASTAMQVIQQTQNTPNVREWYFGKLRASWGNRRMPNNEDGIKPIVMRYTDVLLMFAEAQSFLQGPAVAYGGQTPQQVLARVRARAFPNGGDPLVVSSLGTHEAFLQAIMDERAFEFLGEQRRKYDLIRWNRLKENLDWARRQTLRMRDGCNAPNASQRDIDFAWNDDVRGFSRHIFWRHVPCSCVDVLLCSGTGHTVLEIFGLRRGEFPMVDGQRIVIHAPITQNNPEPAALQGWLDTFRGGGWNRYVGTGAGFGLMLEWIDHRDGGDDGTAGHPLSDAFINNGFYFGAEPLPGTRQPNNNIRVNPDLRSLFPIWASVISASQGTLNNHPFYD